MTEERVFAELQSDASTLHESIRMHLERNFAPDARKYLRSFSSTEAAEFLGLAPGHLRKLHAEDKIPDVPLDERGRKLYSADDLAQIRLALARTTRDPSLYLRGRVGSEPLQIISCVSFKGGSAKTTTAAYLSQWYALHGYRVLVIDMDPQGNASTALGVAHSAGTPGTWEVLLDGTPIAEVVQDSPEAEGLHCVPATVDLAAAELSLVNLVGREQRLKRAIRGYLAENEVDYILFDCPPSLGLLTLNALVAASEILIPIQCEYYALEGVSQLMRTIQLVTDELNTDVRLSTVLLTMFDARTKLSAQVGEEVRNHFPQQTLLTLIPRSVRLSEAPSYGTTIFGYDAASVGAKAYAKAAAEIARRGAVGVDESRGE